MEDAVHVGEGEAVVADGDAGVEGGLEARGQLLASDDAATALDDKGIVGDVLWDGREAAEGLAVELLSSVLGQQGGEFDAPDILARDVVGATFEHQHPVAVFEGVDGRGTLHIFVEQPLGTCQDNAEAGEVN